MNNLSLWNMKETKWNIYMARITNYKHCRCVQRSSLLRRELKITYLISISYFIIILHLRTPKTYWLAAEILTFLNNFSCLHASFACKTKSIHFPSGMAPRKETFRLIYLWYLYSLRKINWITLRNYLYLQESMFP